MSESVSEEHALRSLHRAAGGGARYQLSLGSITLRALFHFRQGTCHVPTQYHSIQDTEGTVIKSSCIQ